MQNKCVGVCDGARCRKSTANLLPPNCAVKPMENICGGVKLRNRCPSHSNFFLLSVRGFHIYFAVFFFFFMLQGTQVVKKKHWALLF